MNNLSVQQLRRVLEIKEKIEQLNSELDQVLSGSGSSSGSASTASSSGQQKRRGRPPGAGAVKAASTTSVASSAGRKKGGRGPMSDEARARIAEAARLRWAKAKKSGKNRL